jgi:ribose transport system permease protein
VTIKNAVLAADARHDAAVVSEGGGAGRLSIRRLSPTRAAPWVILILLYLLYVALQPNAFTLEQTGIIVIGALPLILVAAGQTIVVLSRGLDLSVGGMMSVATTLVATRMTDGSIGVWTVLILLVGAAGGLLNGLLITRARIQPFVVTLATWSLFSGVALLILETQGGVVPVSFASFPYNEVAGIPIGIALVVGLLVLWAWLKRTRLLRRIYAIGSDEGSAFLSGVPVARAKVSAYVLCGILAAAAGLAVTMVTSAGDPTVGTSYILPSIAAVVLGGTSLLGGRGDVDGSVAGALILTLIASVVFVVGLPQYWTPVIEGGLIVVAVLAGSLVLAREARREMD